MKRGQITIFIIIAVSLLFLIIFILALVGKIRDTQLQEEAQKVVDNIFSKSVIENYVTSCLTTVTHDGLKNLGLQGGRLFNYQLDINESDEFSYFQDYNDFIFNELINLSYSIMLTDDDNAPHYPCPSALFYDQNPDRIKDTSCGLEYLGYDMNTYQRIFCTYKHYNPILKKSRCTLGSLNIPRVNILENSLKEQLENYIIVHFPECIGDLSYFNETLGYELDIGVPEANVKFGSEDVHVFMEFPIEVNMEGDYANVVEDYQVNINTRMKTLYDRIIFAKGSPILEEVSNASYNILKGMEEFIGRKNLGFDVQIRRSVNTFDDLLIVRDSETNQNTPYGVYYMLIRNRPPAMDYINNSGGIPDFDVIASPDTPLVVNPVTFDPDDDSLFYTYKGWKADYDCVYNSTTRDCKMVPLSKSQWINPINRSFEYNARTGAAILLVSNDDYRCLKESTTSNCPTIKDPPNEYYETTIMASDGELYDYQDILIEVESSITLADPAIEPLFSYNNIPNVGDPNDPIVSVEDPYRLMEAGLNVLSGYIRWWNFPVSGFLDSDPFYGNYFDSSYICTILPTREECYTGAEPDIETIKDLGLPYAMTHYFPDPGLPMPNLPISLTIETDAGIDTANMEITLVQCIPHRSPTPAYPYSGAVNPYMANHTCCGDDYRYLLSSQKCFDGTSYKCGAPDAPYETMNDVVKVTAVKYCSGDRGNICNGGGFEQAVRYTECGDKTYATDIARCSACSLTPFDDSIQPGYDVEVDPFTTKCWNFPPGHTFEKDVLYPLYPEKVTNPQVLKGYCNDIPECCWGEGAGMYIPMGGGPLRCNATCDGMGFCSYAFECVCSQTCMPAMVPPMCDGVKPGRATEPETCTAIGQPYFPDGCTETCSLGDITTEFRCSPDPASDCYGHCDVRCNHKAPGDEVPGCSAGLGIFADMCSSDGQVIDRTDFICRGSVYDPSCTAPIECEGYVAGMGIIDRCYESSPGVPTNFAARCDVDCQLEQSNICKACPGNTADPGCDGLLPNTVIGCGTGGKSYIAYICNNNCQVMEDPGGRCASGAGCTASPQCDGRLPLLPWNGDSYPGFESGCRDECVYDDCDPYNFNPGEGKCFSATDVFLDGTRTDAEKAVYYCNDPNDYVNTMGFARCKD